MLRLRLPRGNGNSIAESRHTFQKKMEVQASLTVLSVLYEMNRTRSKLYSVEQIFFEKIL